MSKKPRKRKVFGPPPDRKQSMDIAVRILSFAERVAAGEVEAAADDMARWFRPDSSSYRAELRVWYLASAAPVIAMGMVRKYFPVDMEPNDLWILERVPDVPDDDPHLRAMAQVLVRYLNDDTAMARALTSAHFEVHGYDGLFELGLQAVKFTAGVIRHGRAQEEVAS